ncbi:hypothetical protein SSX86_019297 [Deinandra increscens subsp. villosa]|uniref:Cysteine-rich receptor-like protein kinase 2 n=1 Tax=Deinandra increscens subsp. villosa TaxID=3103831 RepID=A0AAP0GVK9_9ASTR
MKQQGDNPTLWSWCLLVTITIAVGPVRSQQTDRNSTRFAIACSQYKGMSEEYLATNLNTTLSSLRRQLSTNNVSYATSRALLNGDAVWGLASCRGYVSRPDCLACFDYAVSQLRSSCGSANGAFVFYDDCDIRYENRNFFAESTVRGGSLQCSNDSSTQETELRKAADGLLSDLRTAVPKTTNFYAASTRGTVGGNLTVYAIGQCNLNLSQSDCAGCINSRYISLDTCLPSVSGRSMDGGCFMKYSITPFFRLDQRTDITPLLGDGDSSKKGAIIGGVVGGVCILFVVLAFFLWRSRTKKSTSSQLDKSTGSTVLLQGPARYSYDDLRKATDDFSDENKLGGGGVFGEVYKGTLRNGDTVAVKKTVMAASTRGNIHIDHELKILCNVHHRHLLRLVGYCSKGPHLFLVHEYMTNGSLDQFLYGDNSKKLNWRQRYEIIYGTARGLAYLHEQYHETIIHRDIKPSNILLDNELLPKIADFGLIRLLPEDKTHLTTKLPGSLESAYVAPEYAILGQLSEKVDTYSFGIVVLEIISGKKCINAKDEESDNQSLLDQAWNLYDSGMHLKLVDDTLDPSEYEPEEAKRMVEIALMCTQPTVSARPAMSEVVTLISEKSFDEMPSVKSTFHDDDVKIQVGDTLSSLSSDATGSTTQVSAR